MKARTEELLRSKGLSDRELKRGLRRHPRHRVRGAAAATRARPRTIRRSAPAPRSTRSSSSPRGGYVTIADARAPRRRRTSGCAPSSTGCSSSTSTRPTRCPPTRRPRTHLARCSGSAIAPGASALEQFDADAPAPPGDRARRSTRSCSSRRCSTRSPASGALLDRRPPQDGCAAFGFRDVEQTRAALRELTAGLTRRSRVMQQLLPAILGWLSDAPDPDLGLLAAAPAHRGLHTALDARAPLPRHAGRGASARAAILGSSRVLGLALHRHPEFVDALADDDDARRRSRRVAELVDEALDTLDWREDDAGRRAGLRRFKRRQLLRIGARDVLGVRRRSTPSGRELSNLADACVEAALQLARTDAAVRGDRPRPPRRRASCRTRPTST